MLLWVWIFELVGSFEGFLLGLFCLFWFGFVWEHDGIYISKQKKKRRYFAYRSSQ